MGYPLQGIKNTEIIRALSEQRLDNGESRFVLYGSLARAALLGHDIAAISDPRNHRFMDVDAIDRTGRLTSVYSLYGGQIDAKTTKTVRPIDPESPTWGLYDSLSDSKYPVAIFPESSLELQDICFNSLHPEAKITTTTAGPQIALADIHRYRANMPKHRDQLRQLNKIARPIDNQLAEALDEYCQIMERRHGAKGYMRIRRELFNHLPGLAVAIQDSSLGKVIRKVRGTRMVTPQPVDWTL